jgi:mRNA interferase RelE/StbE
MQRRVLRELDQLAQDPRGPGSIKLGGTDDLYRRHAGRDYVIVYQIEDDLVLRVADRKEVYRNLPRRVRIERPERP